MSKFVFYLGPVQNTEGCPTGDRRQLTERQLKENQYSFLRIQFPVKIHTFSARSAKNFPLGT